MSIDLSLFHTGDLNPTCGPDQVHTPLIWQFDGKPVRVLIRPNHPVDRALAFVLTDVATALGYKRGREAGRSMNLTEGSDRGANQIRTPGGAQKFIVLTFKGLTKFLMRSDHKTAVEFQDWLASKSSDLAFYGIAFQSSSASAMGRYVTEDRVVQLIGEAMAAIPKVVAQVVVQTIESLPQFQQVQQMAWSPSRKGLRHQSEFPAWTMAEHNRMRRLGYVRASEFLTRELGGKPAYGKPGGLAARAVNYSGQHDIPVYRFFKGSSVLVYVHEDTLRQVHRTGWSARTAILSEAQMGLFGETG